MLRRSFTYSSQPGVIRLGTLFARRSRVGSTLLQWSEQDKIIVQSPLAFGEVTDIYHVGKLTFLICGGDSTGGRVALVRLQPGASPKISILSIETYAGFSCSKAAHTSSSGLVILDARHGALWRSDWTADCPKLPKQTAFARIADQQSDPFLRKAQRVRLTNVDGNLVIHRTGDPGSWSVQKTGDRYGLVRHSPTLKNHGLLDVRPGAVSCQGEFTVRCNAGLLRLMDYESGTVLHQQIVPPGGKPFAIPAPKEFGLHPGRIFVLLAPGGLFKVMRPTIRMGKRLEKPGMSMDACTPVHSYSYVGSSLHGLTQGLSLAPGTRLSSDLKVQAYYLRAFRNEKGVDPVQRVGDYSILQPSAVVEVDRVWGQARRRMTFPVLLPIPKDPDLAGAVCLYQVVFRIGNSDLMFSEVYGTEIRPTRAQRYRPSRGPKRYLAPPSYSTKDKKRALLAAYKWAGADHKGQPQGVDVGKVKALLDAMLEKIR